MDKVRGLPTLGCLWCISLMAAASGCAGGAMDDAVAAAGDAEMTRNFDAGASDGSVDGGRLDGGAVTPDSGLPDVGRLPNGPVSYTLESMVTLPKIIADLKEGGYSALASEFERSGFHPDGIKAGRPCTPSQGKLYVSSIATGSVLRVGLDGVVQPVVRARPAEAYGLTFDARGNLFISYISRFSSVGGIDVVLANAPPLADSQSCYAVPDAQTTVNDLVATQDGKTLYFSDDTSGRIFRCDVVVTDQAVRCVCKPWWSSPATASVAGLYGGVDGLVLDVGEQTLYFNNFQQGKLFKLAINADGSAGTEEVLTSKAPYGSADGMSLSADGRSLYTATFSDTGSAVAETDLRTGLTRILIEEKPQKLLSPGAALTAVGNGELFFISALDLNGLLFGYTIAGTDGGAVVRAVRDGANPLAAGVGPDCP